MEIPRKLDLKDILQLYAGRQDAEDEPMPEQETLNIYEAGARLRLKNAAQLSEKALRNGDVLLDGPDFEEGGMISHASLLHSTVIDDSVPLELVVTTEQTHSKNGGTARGLLNSYLYKGKVQDATLRSLINRRPHEQKPIAEMVAIVRGNEFDLAHRNVRPEYRRQGLGNALLEFIEEFARNKAAQVGEEQIISVNVAQLDVICWLWNNGYRPSNGDDQLRLEKILSGDPSFCIGKKMYVFPQGINKVERGSLNSHNSSLRMKFEKKIIPGEPTVVAEAKTKIRSSVSESLDDKRIA